MRRSDDGSLLLDKGLIPSKARFVRVRVMQGGRLSGCSQSTSPTLDGEETIERRILQARDTVFEEELFHEMMREARAIAAFGVTTRQNLIRVPASEDLEILLDLIDVDEQPSQFNHDTSQQGNSIAEGLAHTIRILLTYAHRQNLKRRTMLPPPLNPKKRPVPEHQLLRPCLAYIQHMSLVQWVQSLLNDVFAVIQSAKVNIPAYTSNIFSTGPEQKFPAPTVEALVERFLMPFESTFQGELLAPRGSFSISICTDLSSPPYGTSFEISFDLPHYPDLKSPGRLSQKEEVEAAITHILLLDVLFAISTNETLHSNSEDKGKAVYPQHGEIIFSTDSLKRKKMKITLSRCELSLQTSAVRCFDSNGSVKGNSSLPTPEFCTWKPLTTPQPLMDYVREIMTRSH